MNSFKAIPLILLATVLTAAAAPRFALVRVKDLYTSLPSTTALQQQIKSERDSIMRDQRAEQLRKIIGELQALQAQLSDKIKRQEAQTLQQEFENFKTEQEKLINRKMVEGMRASLDRIAKMSSQISKERGYDVVFDGSGDTNTGVPFILFSKDAPDLTADVQAALKDSESAAGKPK